MLEERRLTAVTEMRPCSDLVVLVDAVSASREAGRQSTVPAVSAVAGKTERQSSARELLDRGQVDCKMEMTQKCIGTEQH